MRVGILLALVDRPDESIASFEELCRDWFVMNPEASADLQIRWAELLGSIADELDQAGDPTVPLALYDRAAVIVRPFIGIPSAAASLTRFLTGSLGTLGRLGRDVDAATVRAELAKVLDGSGDALNA